MKKITEYKNIEKLTTDILKLNPKDRKVILLFDKNTIDKFFDDLEEYEFLYMADYSSMKDKPAMDRNSLEFIGPNGIQVSLEVKE